MFPCRGKSGLVLTPSPSVTPSWGPPPLCLPPPPCLSFCSLVVVDGSPCILDHQNVTSCSPFIPFLLCEFYRKRLVWKIHDQFRKLYGRSTSLFRVSRPLSSVITIFPFHGRNSCRIMRMLGQSHFFRDLGIRFYRCRVFPLWLVCLLL